MFERDDFARLADQPVGIRGRFLLSMNATDRAREVFGRFEVEEVEVTYTVLTSPAGKRVKEMIASG